MYTIEEINQIDPARLTDILGNVVEKYPDIVIPAMSQSPFPNVREMCKSFAETLEKLSDEEKLRILQLHPILAGAAADRNELTVESTAEQRSAELTSLEKDKKLEFNALNAQYMKKFTFPFVICARENKAKVMMEQIQLRLHNDAATELRTGINEVKKICALRIADIVKDS